MNFKHRLAYYLFGAMIGIMFLIFFLGNKNAEFCYLPNCRVLKNIRSKAMVIAPDVQQMIDDKKISLNDIKACTENGNVDFSRSKGKYKGGTVYIIEGETVNNKFIEIEMVNYDNKVLLKEVKNAK